MDTEDFNTTKELCRDGRRGMLNVQCELYNIQDLFSF